MTASLAHSLPTRSLRRFLATEVAGGVVLLIATFAALVWANSPFKESYATLWETHLTLALGDHTLDLSLHDWVNDGLMAVFFLVVGLEIKRELVRGELRNPRRAAVPVIAAVGGMVVPALVYVAFNAGGSGSSGWGIPMATDIAFALGVVALFGPRIPSSLKLFLLTLAIVDDIGAIVVIAIFYSEGVAFDWLALGGILLVAVVVMQRLRINWTPAYVIVGTVVWFAVHESGVHATIAGAALGLLSPTEPALDREIASKSEALSDLSSAGAARHSVRLARESVSAVEWLEHLLHPWSSFAIIPVFALANAGVPLSVDALSDAVTSPVTAGVVFGLVVGKLVGVSLFSWIAVRTGVGVLPDGSTWRDVIGVAAVAGIGFTVSLFLSALAFTDATLIDEARIGILAGSLIAGLLAAAILLRPRGAAAGDPVSPLATAGTSGPGGHHGEHHSGTP